MPLRILFFIIIIEGFISISIEILTLRQLLPFTGNNVIVSSIIIGFFLLFLAYGYLKGGAYDKKYCKILRRNFLISSAIIGVGLSYNFVSVFFNLLDVHVFKNYLVTLCLYLSLIVAPLVFLLGQTVPITTNLFKEKYKINKISAKILHLSTLGSFFGSILTSLLLINFLGVAWTVFINCALLTVLAITISPVQRITEKVIIPSACVLVIAFFVNVKYEKNHFLLTNIYGNYQLVTSQDKNLLVINESLSSFSNGKQKGFKYVELIKKVLFKDLKLKEKDILVLGAGSFSLSEEKLANNQFTYVDIDKEVLNIAKKNIKKKINGDFVVNDARLFLNQTDKKYDVIIADAYSNKNNIPSHLTTTEYFHSVKDKIKDGGYALFNVIGKPTMKDNYSKRLDNTIKTAFSNCMVIPNKYTDDFSNILYVCNNHKNDYAIYTDNKNPVTIDKAIG